MAAKSRTAKHEFSAGARYERKAIRAYLERYIKRLHHSDTMGALVTGNAMKSVLTWVRGRQSRYDKKEGGL